MKRVIAILILSAMIVSFVAPFLGESKNINETDVAAQTESTEQTYLLTGNFLKMQEKIKEEIRNNTQNDKEKIDNEVKDELIAYQEYSMSYNSGFKSYMSYTTITSQSSPQYILQNQYAYTGEFGIRKVEDRFCIAIGQLSNARVGTYVDLILENEIVIPCIVGDFKANVHTDSSNMVTGHNGCVSEFIVEKERLPYVVRNNDNTGTGDISHCKEDWISPVKTIKVYEKNIFDGE